MKRRTDIYHRWVAWSEEDQVYIGRCPDLFLGGVHGDDPVEVARELQQAIDEWDELHDGSQPPLPPVRVRPMIEVA
jgi:predicted RNase H-like HicB family nuclease